MDNKQIGTFISELRKSKKMTQKELAEKLNVTDKAVSKWERGAGYPDITLLPKLADALDVTTSELLLGKHMEEESELPQADTEPIVRSAVDYAQKSRTEKSKKFRMIAFYSISLSFLLAAGICALCNYVSRRTLDWSLYVIGGEAAAWLTITPLLCMKKHRWTVSMAALTVSSVPLLLLIKALCPSPELIFPFVFPIMAISIGSLWILLLLTRLKISLGYFISLILIIYGVGVQVVLNWFIHGYLHSGDSVANAIITGSCAFAAVVVAAVTRVINRSAQRVG